MAETTPQNRRRQRFNLYTSSFFFLLLQLQTLAPATSFIPFISSDKIRQNHVIVPSHQHPKKLSIGCRKQSWRLNAISDWRDIMFDFLGTSYKSVGGSGDDVLPREICVFPFPYEDVLLQGETKQLHLYEDRFIKLFDKCMNDHCGVVAMGLIAESGIIQTVPLCEVEAYNRMEGLGIFVTIRVVGRASLLELTQQEPYIKGVCMETSDKIPPNLDFPNLVASNIENFMVTLSSLEHRLKKTSASEKEDAYADDDPDRLDVNDQFKEAFRQAKNSDSQGYMVCSSDGVSERSIQDLNAISWAAFCIDDVDETIRIQALDSCDLFDRLKLGSYMLREKKAELEAKLALTGMGNKNDDDDDDKF